MLACAGSSDAGNTLRKDASMVHSGTVGEKFLEVRSISLLHFAQRT